MLSFLSPSGFISIIVFLPMRLLLVFPVFLSLLFALPSLAISAEWTARVAKERAAKKACAVGDVMTGIDLLAELYVETNEPNYIHNQARCYQQNDDPAHAIMRFQEYLRQVRDLGPNDQAVIEGYIAECEAQLAKKSSPTTPPVLETKPEPIFTPPPISTPKPNSPAAPPSPARLPGQGLRIAGVITGIVGVAALGTGLIFDVLYRDLDQRIKQNTSKDTPNNQKIRENYDIASDLFYLSGGVLVPAGVVFYLIGYAMEPTGKIALRPRMGPKHLGLCLHGTF